MKRSSLEYINKIATMFVENEQVIREKGFSGCKVLAPHKADKDACRHGFCTWVEVLHSKFGGSSDPEVANITLEVFNHKFGMDNNALLGFCVPDPDGGCPIDIYGQSESHMWRKGAYADVRWKYIKFVMWESKHILENVGGDLRDYVPYTYEEE